MSIDVGKQATHENLARGMNEEPLKVPELLHE